MPQQDYATAKFVYQHIAQLSAARLREWAIHGWLRTVKLGETRQATRLYHLGDIRDVLERMSRGQLPTTRRRANTKSRSMKQDQLAGTEEA